MKPILGVLLLSTLLQAQNIITTVAGGGEASGTDGGPATSVVLQGPTGIVFDAAGNYYFSDYGHHRVRKVTPTGIISTVAGTGVAGFSGDGGPATAATLRNPRGLAFDPAGNLYIADHLNRRIRRIDMTTGTITTFAGNSIAGFAGDNDYALAASFLNPWAIAFDVGGNLYIADTNNNRIRKVNTAGVVSTVVGSGPATSTGDGGPSINATLSAPTSVAVDSNGALYITEGNRIRKAVQGGTITTIAGSNSGAYSGDGGLATDATLYNPVGVTLTKSGLVYIADAFNGRVRVIDEAGIITTFAGGGAANTTTPRGDGGPASSAFLNTPSSVALDPFGNVLITEDVDIRKVTTTPTPGIDAGGVVNASGYQAMLTPGSVFTIFGRNIGPANLISSPAPNYPAQLGGTTVTFTPTSGAAGITAKLVYSSSTQVAGLLPSSLTPGTYTVQILYNGQTSNPTVVSVVPRSFGIATVNNAGTGPAQATIGNLNGGLALVRATSGTTTFGGYNWILSPAHPGDTLVLWGTGGGADLANDSGGSSGDQTQAGAFQVNVAGRLITPLYAGTSQGYPGLWQINFTLPADIPARCAVSIQVQTGVFFSNATTIDIAPNGQPSCTP